MDMIQENKLKERIKKGKQKFKSGQVFDTIADVGSLFMATLYILYVSILLIFGFGTPWLNYSMLAITIIYIAFFITKLTALNRVMITKQMKKKTRFIVKYSKWSMKIVNAVFIIMLIATASQHDAGNIFMMIGVFIAIFSFIFSVMWDVAWFIARRRLREFRENWNQLSRKEKNDRIGHLLEDFLHSLDYFTGADISETLSAAGPRSKKQDQQHKSQEPKPKELAQISDDQNQTSTH